MQLSSRLNKHIAVAASAAACVGAANAAVVYSGVVNISIPFNIDGSYMNVETGVYTTTGGAAGAPGWDVNPYGSSTTAVSLFAATGTGYMRNPGAGTSTARTNIAEGTDISAASFFYGSSSATMGSLVGQWAANSSGIFGFKFLAADGLTHYGWMRLAIGANASSRTVVDYGYESTAATGLAAGVPAPGAVALLGLAGLISRRRRA